MVLVLIRGSNSRLYRKGGLSWALDYSFDDYVIKMIP